MSHPCERLVHPKALQKGIHLLPVTERALELAMTAAQAAADKKAQDIVVIDVADQLFITDAFVIASARSRSTNSMVGQSFHSLSRA